MIPQMLDITPPVEPGPALWDVTDQAVAEQGAFLLDARTTLPRS